MLSAVKHKRWKGGKSATLAHRFSAFFLTSCLSTTVTDAHALTDTPGPTPANKGYDPAKLGAEQYDLLTLSIHQIVDEFFTPKTIAAPQAFAQALPGPSPAPAPAPSPAPALKAPAHEASPGLYPAPHPAAEHGKPVSSLFQQRQDRGGIPFAGLLNEQRYDTGGIFKVGLGAITNGLEAAGSAIIPDAVADPGPMPAPQCLYDPPNIGTFTSQVGNRSFTVGPGTFVIESYVNYNTDNERVPGTNSCASYHTYIYPVTNPTPGTHGYLPACSGLSTFYWDGLSLAPTFVKEICDFVNDTTHNAPDPAINYHISVMWIVHSNIPDSGGSMTSSYCAVPGFGQGGAGTLVGVGQEVVGKGMVDCASLITYTESPPYMTYPDYAPPGEGAPPKMHYSDSYGDSYGVAGYADAYGIAEAHPGYCEYGDKTGCYGDSLGIAESGYAYCLPDSYYYYGTSVFDSPNGDGGGSGDCSVGSGGIDVAADSACPFASAADGCMAFEDPIGQGGGGSGGDGCGSDDGGSGFSDSPPIGTGYDTYYDTFYDYTYDTYYDSGICYNDYACPPPPPPYDSPPPAYDSYFDSFYDSYNDYNCVPYQPESPYYPGRLPDSYSIPAMVKDTRLRDLCISGGKLPQSDFDTQTGMVSYFTDPSTGYTAPPVDLNLFAGNPYDNPDLLPSSYFSDSLTVFDEKIAGTISGVKNTQAPQAATLTATSTTFIDNCAPAKDTNAVPLNLAELSVTTNPKTSLPYLTTAQATNMAFNFFVNINNVDTQDAMSMSQVYVSSFPYLNTTFFISSDVGQVEGCPDFLIPNGTITTVLDASQYRQAQAENCYNYYILNHSVAPWYTLERPSGGTGEGLSTLKTDRAVLNNCQPLINGVTSRAIQSANWLQQTSILSNSATTSWETSTKASFSKPDVAERKTGFSPVIMSEHRADQDEAEYLLSTYLQKAWNQNFNQAGKTNPSAASPLTNITLPGGMNPDGTPPYVAPTYQLYDKSPPPNYTGISLPCIQDPYGNNVVSNANPSADERPTCQPPPSADSPPCAPPYRKIPSDYVYNSPTLKATSGFYCPNVEKIIEPSHPYSPRDDIATKSPTALPDGSFITPHTQIYQPDPTTAGKLQLLGASKTITDRDYSYATSVKIPWYQDSCGSFILGWSNFQATGADTGPGDSFLPKDDAGSPISVDKMKDPTSDPVNTPSWQTPHPVVQCGVVPVDILNFRSEAFDSCIMQRIDVNYNAYIDQSIAAYKNGGKVLPPFDPSDLDRNNPKPQTNPNFATNFKPPCATRFWERDDISGCPVKMSIQQCCHIIVKDLVPANFLKLRTCEGLLDARRNDHVTSGKNLQDYFSTLEQTLPPKSVGEDTYGDWTTFINTLPYVTTLNDNGAMDTTGHFEAPGIAQGANTASFNFRHTPLSSFDNYNNILLAAVMLNHSNDKPTPPVACLGTEPKEYTFANWFQSYYLPKDPAITSPSTNFTDLPSHYGELVGYHMPYMRWWDTGTSAGQNVHGGSFVNTLGGFDTIIGVGREERDSYDARTISSLVNNITQESGGPTTLDAYDYLRLKKMQTSQMGRIGGWAELKAHEMETIRRQNLFCIGRYEKLFKQNSAEEFVLGKAGAGFDTVNQQQTAWPLGWRGYVTDSYLNPAKVDSGGNPLPTNRFPYVASYNFRAGGVLNVPGYPVAITSNLDNALPRDIVMYKINGIQQIAYVAASHVTDPKYPYVTLLSWDQGKFPTSTGMSISAGFGHPRNIYKTVIPPDSLAEMLKYSNNMYATVGTAGQPSCSDPYVNSCVLPSDADVAADPSNSAWSNVIIYRPYEDLRPCLGYNTPLTLASGGPSTFSLNDTYNYMPWSGTKPGNTVILQQYSQKLSTDLWGYCLNAGFDPPRSWGGDYNGPGTGASTKAAVCGPEWSDCSTASKTIQYFPPRNLNK